MLELALLRNGAGVGRGVRARARELQGACHVAEVGPAPVAPAAQAVGCALRALPGVAVLGRCKGGVVGAPQVVAGGAEVARAGQPAGRVGEAGGAAGARRRRRLAARRAPRLLPRPRRLLLLLVVLHHGVAARGSGGAGQRSAQRQGRQGRGEQQALGRARV